MRENNRFSKRINYKLFAIMIFVVTLLIMRGNEATFKTYSDGVNILDMRFGYEADEAYQMFLSLGQEGRVLYIKLLFVDFVFIISLALVQNYILRRIMGNAMLNSRWHLMLWIAYLRGLFDMIENMLILIMLFSFPMAFSSLVAVASFATILKFIMLGLWVMAIPLSLVVKRYMKNNVNKIVT